MRKFVIPFLAVMLSLSIVACGGNSDSDNKDKTTQSDKKKDGKKSKKDKKNKDKKNKKETKDSESTTEKETSEKETKVTSNPSFEEIVVVDNDECKITIKDVDIIPDSTWGYSLKTQLENKSSDKTYIFNIDSAVINGVTTEALLSKDVAPGKKANDNITFMDMDLKENGVGDYTDIELTFNVSDYNDWSADPVTVETVHIYPFGEDKATTFVREPQTSDNIIMDNEYATVIVTGYNPDGFWGYTVNLYLVNKSDKNLSFIAGNVSVNGFMMDPYFSPTIPAGKVGFATMSWSSSTFEENNITHVDEIEFDLRLGDNDDWKADEYVNETIKLTPGNYTDF